MNPSEKRRKELLERTRNLYTDSRIPPAVHPRYHSLYGQLYGTEEEEETVSTFGIRAFICFLLLAAFITMDRQDKKLFETIGSKQIVQEIQADFQPAQVWENL